MMDPFVVNTAEGKIRGKEHKTPNGTTFYGFHGISYAEPPTDRLRFKDPIPVYQWQDIKDCTVEDNIGFAQIELLTENFIGTESLTLNVYTPTLSNNKTSPLPVMVFFHGGGFVGGLSSKDEFGPDHLIEKDVVTVTVQYRLGVFGFLCLDLTEAPGNAGLKDQVLALQWVQRNIHAFNGDSSNVTIFGTSAGAASVEYHIVSPMSKNLFHKAIAHSGSALNPWALNLNAKKSAVQLSKILGKYSEDSKEILELLVSISAQDLVQAANEYSKIAFSSPSGGLDFTFIPTIEKTFDSVSCFLSENPLEIFKTGRHNKVPLLTGYCEREGLIYEYLLPTRFNTMLKETTLSSIVPFKIEDESLKNELDAYYFKNKIDYDRVVQFLGDMDFNAGIYLSAKLQSCNNPHVYLYNFKFEGTFNILRNILKLTKPGATHADQEGYVCTNKYTLAEGSEIDKLVRERILQMWTNFAKWGNPTPKTSTAIDIAWTPVTNNKVCCLNIDRDLTIQDISNEEWTSLWQRVYEYSRV